MVVGFRGCGVGSNCASTSSFSRCAKDYYSKIFRKWPGKQDTKTSRARSHVSSSTYDTCINARTRARNTKTSRAHSHHTGTRQNKKSQTQTPRILTPRVSTNLTKKTKISDTHTHTQPPEKSKKNASKEAFFLSTNLTTKTSRHPPPEKLQKKASKNKTISQKRHNEVSTLHLSGCHRGLGV